jgi:hypothetical protein
VIARVLLRATAIGIAVAAFIDPSFNADVSQRSPLTIVAVGLDAVEHATRVRDRVGDVADAQITIYEPTSHAAACPERGGCVVISPGAIPARLTAGAELLGAIRIGNDTSLLSRIDAPSPIHRDAAAVLRVETTRRAQRIQVLDGEVLIGEAVPEGNATDVPFVPVGDGARPLRVVADNETADVGVRVIAEKAAVLYYEPQATWLGSFVRRALDDDGRFDVGGRTRLAPAISVSRGAVDRLDAQAVEDVSTVVITAPERLTAAEVDVLDRFVARRGGSLIVLADERPAGAALRLLPRIVNEGSSSQPEALGPLRASEWLTFESGAGVSTIAAIDKQPVIVARAVGRGHVIVSGALDAWRYRQASSDFDTFWTALVWDASAIAGPRLRVDTDRLLARPGEEIAVTVELQTMSADLSGADVAAMSYAQCGDERHFVRLWPEARPGTFKGTLRIDQPGTCTLRASVDEVAGNTSVTIRDELRRVEQHTDQLEAMAAAHAAPFATSGDEEELFASIRARLKGERHATEYWPMRSALWLLPFALCAGAEWWLRRRSGLS